MEQQPDKKPKQPPTLRGIRASIEEETKGMTAEERKAYYENKSGRKVTQRKRLQ